LGRTLETTPEEVVRVEYALNALLFNSARHWYFNALKSLEEEVERKDREERGRRERE
jgi:hypothetical protein